MREEYDPKLDELYQIYQELGDAAKKQIRQAHEHLAIDRNTLCRLEWDALHEPLGELFPGRLWVVVAESGHGKSTVLMNVAFHLLAQGKKIWHAPLEQTGSVMRQYLAAFDLGLPTKAVLRGRLAPDDLERVKAHLDAQLNRKDWQIGFSDIEILNKRTASRLFDEAMAVGADILIIDHLNQTEGGYNELRELCYYILRECREQSPKGMTVLAAAQIGRDKMNRDPFHHYYPPRSEMILGGGSIYEVADVVIGAWRPLQAMITTIDRAVVKGGFKKARDFCRQGAIGLNIMKDRVGGNIGDNVILRYDRGRILNEVLI